MSLKIQELIPGRFYKTSDDLTVYVHFNSSYRKKITVYLNSMVRELPWNEMSVIKSQITPTMFDGKNYHFDGGGIIGLNRLLGRSNDFNDLAHNITYPGYRYYLGCLTFGGKYFFMIAELVSEFQKICNDHDQCLVRLVRYISNKTHCIVRIYFKEEVYLSQFLVLYYRELENMNAKTHVVDIESEKFRE